MSNPLLLAGRPPGACGASAGDGQLRWVRAVARDEQPASDQWCSAVGPAIAVNAAGATDATAPLTIVSWNTHVGGADIVRLVRDARAGRLTGKPVGSLVLLLQEVYRKGDGVPGRPPAHSRSASPQTPSPPASTRQGIAATADTLGLSLLYVPSMRNGLQPEDRGNAILSSAPLDEPEALELPLERQRRVTVSARVRIRAATPLTLRIVSTHFTNMVGHHLWVVSEPGRVRQARALAAALGDDEPTVLGGDLNSWFGYKDASYRELARVLPLARPIDRRPTFGPMRLDHVLARLPPGWQVAVRRADSRYGSDHFPLIATLSTPR